MHSLAPNRFHSLFALVLAALVASSAAAQTATPTPAAATAAAAPATTTSSTPARAFPDGLWVVSDENDTYFGTDRDLTNVLRLAYSSPNYATWDGVPAIPKFAGSLFDDINFLHDASSSVSSSIYAQQNMYTPSNISRVPPNPNDRPWAGWVGLGIDAVRQTAMRRAVLELNLGWVGPESGAEALQTSWHDTINVTHPRGWGYQLKNEPVLQLTYRQDWRLPAPLSNVETPNHGPIDYDVTVHALATAGNGWDYIQGGIMTRVGFNLPRDFGPARPRLGSVDTQSYLAPGAAAPTFGWDLSSLSAYVCLGVDDRAVARDITLDGNTFARSPSVNKEPVVAEAYSGLVLQWGNLYSSFIAVYETKTFQSQVAPQWRGILSLGCRF